MDLFAPWIADGNPWSAWAKPALFATAVPMPAGTYATPPMPWLPADRRTVLVIDLPGAESVAIGAALAGAGWAPVPLFNGCQGPAAIVDLDWAGALLAAVAPVLASTSIAVDAAPAFLLDSQRMRGGEVVAPGRFDNRWQVLPQDMPSGNRLVAAGYDRALVVQDDGPVRDDLCHVLRRWQEAGVSLRRSARTGQDAALDVPRPVWFRNLAYLLGVWFSLRRNSAGGFGSVVPEPSSGGG